MIMPNVKGVDRVIFFFYKIAFLFLLWSSPMCSVTVYFNAVRFICSVLFRGAWKWVMSYFPNKGCSGLRTISISTSSVFHSSLYHLHSCPSSEIRILNINVYCYFDSSDFVTNFYLVYICGTCYHSS